MGDSELAEGRFQQLLPAELMGKLERMELVSRKIFRGRMKGERRSPRKGQSVEFADFRNYTPGDDLRFIDWNLYARLDRLYLKLFLEEEDLHFFGLIDNSLSMSFGQPSKLEVAKRLMAALGYIGLCRGDRIVVQGHSQTSRPAKAHRSRASLPQLLDQIERIQPEATPSFREAVGSFCLRNPGRGIVVWVTDLMDKSGYESAMRLLMARRMDLYVIHLLSPDELLPQATGDLRLTDCEDGDQREVSITPGLLARYQERLGAFLDGAKTFCQRRTIAYLPARSDLAVDRLVNEYLRQRGLVR
jgi:uncharacterized protein (DUF58 family)